MGSKYHNMEITTIYHNVGKTDMEWTDMLRTMDQYERLTPSCWVPCLIGHKEVPACLASPVSIQSKI